MNLSSVRYFLAVCETRGFSAAAKACGVSQPAVTSAVRRLEQIVGGKLFARSQPVKLTPLGVKLRPAFQGLQSAADRVAAQIDASGVGTLTIRHSGFTNPVNCKS